MSTRAVLICAALGLAAACGGGDDLTTTGVETETETETETDPSTTEGTTEPTTTLLTTSTTSTDPTTTETETETDPSETETVGSETDTETSESESDTEGATLCERLGGVDGIAALHDGFLGRVLSDQRINGYFLNDDVDAAALLSCLNDQIGEAVECPGVTYGCQDMLAAHAGLGISTQDFNDLAEDYSLALDDHEGGLGHALTPEDKAAVLDVLAGMAGDIVEDAAGDQTIYQRVGRKPGILALVGAPGEDGSFIDNVANDAAINGFFYATDFGRLNTCLMRQIAALDGPVKYGAEVDSPGPGIDEGVDALMKCLDMCGAHADLTNPDNGDAPITADDFSLLMTDLSDAMVTAGVLAEDQLAIGGAMAPLCTAIVADPGTCPDLGATKDVVLEALDLNFDIPDDGYDGSLESMACVNLPLMNENDGYDAVAGVSLTVAIDHTWVGDLVIKIESPSGTVTTPLSRPGLLEPVDDGVDCCGDTSNLSAAAPITFVNDGPDDAELIGADLTSNQIACADDQKCEYFPNAGNAPGVDLDDFDAEDAYGLWRVCVGDSTNMDTGVIQAVSLTVTKSNMVYCD
ncbi:MAG: proprotein convertase P-domain-containing protein [Nannocystaceae bacterium]